MRLGKLLVMSLFSLVVSGFIEGIAPTEFDDISREAVDYFTDTLGLLGRDVPRHWVMRSILGS